MDTSIIGCVWLPALVCAINLCPIAACAGLHSAQRRPNVALVSMLDLVVLCNTGLYKLMRPTKMESSPCPLLLEHGGDHVQKNISSKTQSYLQLASAEQPNTNIHMFMLPCVVFHKA